MLKPGPEDASVLTKQKQHRSEAIFEGEEYGPLKCRYHSKALLKWKVDERVTEFISTTQFRGVQRMCFIALDPDLITALVERWREETHTFHLPFGEVTITLQDVNVLLGLRVKGRPVTGSSDYIWPDLLEEYLGIRPPPEAFDGAKLSMTWLRSNFEVVRGDDDNDGHVSEDVLHRHVRAYLLYLFGTVLFPDKSGDSVRLVYFPLLCDLTKIDEISWGSGVLAYLYRNMCAASKKKVSQIGGALLLLQLWSWERLSIGRPTILRSRVALEDGKTLANFPLGTQLIHRVDPLGCKWLRVDFKYNDHKLGLSIFRDLLDTMTESQFTWRPYTSSTLANISPLCSEDTDEWLVICPMICFGVIEWHFPERCVRQFGWHQTVPPVCNTVSDLHLIDRRGGGKKNYEAAFAYQIKQWNDRKLKMVTPTDEYLGPMDYNDNYLLWYRRITRLLVGPPKASRQPEFKDRHYYNPTAADFEALTQMSVCTYNEANQMLKIVPDDGPLALTQSLQRLRLMSRETLERTQQGHLIQYEEATETDTQRTEETQDDTQRTEETHRTYHLRSREEPTPRRDAPESSSGAKKTKKTRRR